MQNLNEETLETKASPKQSQKIIGVLMMEAGTEFLVLIAGPLLLGVFLGRWVDSRTHHAFFVIIGILLGLSLSVVAVGKRIKDYKSILDNKLNKK